MKRVCQIIIAIAALYSFTNASCNKAGKGSPGNQLTDAVITGIDQRLCPCCGGFFINFDGETKPLSGKFYLVDNDLSAYGVSSSATFPLAVRVKYQMIQKCNGNFVNISKLEKK